MHKDYSLFYYNPLPSWVYASETFQILDVNQAAIDHYGYTKEEFLSMTIKQLRPKGEVPKLLAAHSNIHEREGNIYFGVFTHQKKNGELIRMEINGHKIEFRHTQSIMVICQDVTEREKMIQALQLSEQRLKTASEIAKLGYWRLEMDKQTLWWSDQVYEIWGRKQNDFKVTFDSFFETIHPDDRELFVNSQNNSFVELKQHNLVHRILLPDGSVKWVHEKGRFTLNEVGDPVAFEGTVQDISSLKAEEQRLKLLESVITHSTDAIIITEAEPFDEPGPRIVFVNEAFTKMTGYTANEVIGKTPRILQGPKSNQSELARLSKALKNGEPCEITTINYKKNGEPFWINFSVSPVANEKGSYTHWIAIERDVTAAKTQEIEKELLSRISIVFNQHSNLNQSLQNLCEIILGYGDFSFAEVWLPDVPQKKLKLVSHCKGDDFAEIFYEQTEQIQSFSIGEGLPGMVWTTKKIEFLGDLPFNVVFKRKNAAEHAGINTIMGIPLLHNTEMVGVLVVGSILKKTHLKQYRDVLSRIELLIGAEIARKKLEADLSHLFEALPDLICLADFEGRFLKINEAGCKLLGYQEKEIVGFPFDLFVHPADKDVSANEIKKLSEGETVFKFENRYITKTGETIWLSWHCNSLVDEGVIYATAKNITEDKKLQELAGMAIKVARIGGWEIDMVQQKIIWSPMVHELHETDPESFVPELVTAINFYREDHREMVTNLVENSIANGSSFDFEAPIITAKGKELWVRAIGKAEFYNGECLRVYGSFQDISDRKESSLRLQSISDDLPGVAFQYIMLPDGSDYMRSVSKAAFNIWGLTPEECEANNQLVWDQIKAGGDYDEIQASISKSVSANSKWNFKWRNILPSGELRWHEGFGTPNRMADGSVVFNSMIFDITDEKKATILYEDTSQTARIGIWELDIKTGDLFLSKIARELHELDDEVKVTLEQGIDFYREDFREEARYKIMQGIEKGASWEFELPVITAKGNERWIRGIGQSQNIDGKPRRIYGSIQDIHERKMTELRLKSITNDLPGVAFQYYLYPDGTDKLVSVSNGSYKIWGVSPEECEKNISQIWDQIKKGGQYEQVVKEIMYSIETLTQWNSRWRNVLPNGTIRWHEGYGTPYRLADGTISFNSMVFDITEKKNLANLYAEASTMALIGSWELDLLNQTGSDNMYWSPMVKSILDVAPDYNPSLTGGFEFYKEESKQKIQLAVEKLMADGTEFDEELLITTLTGKEKWIRCIGKSERIDGKCTKIYGSFQDIHSLKSTALQLEETLGSISDAFYAVDKNWNFTYFNKEAENLLKRKSSDVLGKNIWEEFAPAKGTELDNIYHRVAANGIPENFEYYYPGDHLWYQVTTYPSNGGVSSYFKNITDKRKAAEELQRAYEEKNMILESIGDGFFAVDKNWIVTYWNKEAENILGRQRAEMIDKNLWEVYADATELDFYSKYHEAMATGKTIAFQEFYPTLRKWFEVSVYPSAKGLSVFFKDITLRKQTDIQIIQANERFEKVTEATNDAIWDWNIEDNTLYWGNGFKNLFGYDIDKVTPTLQSWTDHIHPEDLEQVLNTFHVSLDQSGTWFHEYRYLKADGSYAFVVSKGKVIRDKNGKPIRMVGAMTDITYRKEYELQLLSMNESLQHHAKELENKNEQLEQFAFITSHDLQEPLRMISSFLNQLKRKYEHQLDDQAHQYIHFATDGSKRMKQIILDLLEYSRAGKRGTNVEEINLQAHIDEYKILRRKIIEEKHVVLHTTNLPILRGYKTPLVQTLHSLLDNAIKYAKQDLAPVIQLSVQDEAAQWVIKIQDNGIGIDPQFFDKIFIIFQRLHDRDQYGGTGIGLSIAKKNVESWGGSIWLESEKGKGTTFYFTIKKES